MPFVTLGSDPRQVRFFQRTRAFRLFRPARHSGQSVDPGLTTLDILKRHLPDGQLYYLLHIKPSKYDRARVIPIGDGLGRVIAEIIGHIKAFYHAGAVPACDRRDYVAKTPL